MKKRLCSLMLALVVSACTLSGCWEEPLPEEEDLPFQTEDEEPQDNREILPEQFALPYDPNATLDPITCADGMQQTVGTLLYQRLFQLDENLEPQPELCQSYTCSADALTYTFTIRSGVTFWDGTALTAADVASSLQRARSSQRYGSRLSRITSISAGDANTVTVTLAYASTGLPALLDIPIVKSGTESELIPVGSGLYCFHQDEDGPSLQPNPYWQGSTLPVQEIVLSPAGDRDAMLYQFTSHDVQLIVCDLTGTEPVTSVGNVSYQDADTTILQYLGFNTQRSPFDNAALRRALSLGINRSALISAFFSGHALAAQFPVSPVSSLYPQELETIYSYDAFASAMAAAGYATGTTTKTVTLVVNQENTFKVSAAQDLAEALSAFDLKIQVSVLPWEEYTAALAAGNFDLYFGEIKLTADWNLSSLLSSGGALNYGGWADPQTDTLLSQYAVSQDRAGAMKTLCTYLNTQAPILPICFKRTSVLYQAGVIEGLQPTAANPFYNLSDCTIHLAEKAN